MADNFNPSPSQSGAYYPQDFSLDKLEIVMSSGKTLNIKKILVEMSYYEDIFAFCSSGSITVRDAQNLIETFQLTGNEYIHLNFGKLKNGANSIDQRFRVYKIGKRIPTGNLNDEFYTLHFCSEELFLSEQMKIAKSLGGQKISDLIKNILKQTLKTDANKIGTIEETFGTYNFVIPRFKPFEAISWLATYARPVGGVGSDFVFYQNTQGYNFRSLQTIYKDNVYATYRYQQKNLSDSIQPFQSKFTTVLDYEFVKTYDTLNDVSSGVYANKIITIDPMTRTHRVNTFNYFDYANKASNLNANPAINQSTNRDGTKLTEAYDSVTKYAVSNANQAKHPYIAQVPGSVANDIYLETYVPYRTGQLNLANYTVVKIMVPGDPGLHAGAIVQFDLMTTKPDLKKRDLDKFYSGKYLVTALRHIVSDAGSYITVLELAKESVTNKYAGFAESSTLNEDKIL